ncbi:MAG: bifunctional oligoribonuclease/PAP phosphatase NrnA [Clostridia bacterium]|nr:bifunctional oligoribonuclease/PAP phosphatase NrnA [Clostridia bacterium]
MPRAGLEAVARAVADAGSLAVCCHVNPDGDTLGSALALKAAFPGKQVTVFCPDKVPDNLAGLPGAAEVRLCASLQPEERFDLMLPVDISEASRGGRMGEKPFLELLRARCGGEALIDHHGTNPGFCRPACIDAGAPATGLIIRELLGLLGQPLTAEIAACLYAAIATDTGNFSYGNVSPECFRVAAELVATGFDMNGLNRRLFVVEPLAKKLLLGRALNSLRMSREGRIALMAVTRADFAACGALEEHTENLVNQALAIEGVCMAALLREVPDGTVKASLRGVAPWTVDRAAVRFGGGGHAQAAGCSIPHPMAESLRLVEEALGEELDRQT